MEYRFCSYDNFSLSFLSSYWYEKKKKRNCKRKKNENFVILGVAIFANLANCWRLVELTRIDMLIMSYGGLRGAIAFALALILDDNKIERKKEFVTATIAVVFFTVFFQVKLRKLNYLFELKRIFNRVLQLVHWLNYLM
jgi:dipeptide/tripeptide permease